MLTMVGVSHQTAALEVRERLAVGPEALPDVLAALRERFGAGAVLATCNRVEVYLPGEHDRSEVIAAIAAPAGFEAVAREEAVLFPALLDGHPDLPFEVFEAEHAAAGDGLARLRELTEDYVAPADACNTWRALWAGLEDLETVMHEHVHLENNILFPRASGGAAS